MKACAHPDEEIDYLCTELEAAKAPQEDSPIRIALVGVSASGKSTLINSILGIEGLALSGDGGNSVTQVAQKFSKASADQKSSFLAEVCYLNRQERNSILRNCLRSSYDYLHRNDGIEDPADRTDPGEDDREWTTAMQIFTAIFADRNEFMDEQSAEEFLRQASSSTDSSMLGEMERWVQDLLDSVCTVGDITQIEANHVMELNEQLRPYISKSKAAVADTIMESSPSLWPMVSGVKVHLRSKLLEKNIIIADLPGISDVNQHVVRITMAYLRRAEVTMIVGTIGRYSTDTTIHQKLREALWKRKTGGTVILVATRSDDLGIEDGKSHIPLTEEHQEELGRLDEHIENAKERLKEIKAEIAEAVGNKRKIRRLKKQREHQKDIMEAAKRAKDPVYAAARNAHVTREMEAKCTKMTDDGRGPIPTFCVSNAAYQAYQNTHSRDNDPKLSLIESGIPQLRQCLYSLPSTRIFSNFEYHCKFKMDILLHTLELSCMLDKVERKGSLGKIVHDAHSSALTSSEEVFSTLKRNTVDKLLPVISGAENRMIHAADRLLKKWETWNTHALRAFCKHSGDWQTGSIPAESWNVKLLEAVVLNIEPTFDVVHQECVSWAGPAADAFDRRIDGILKLMRKQLGISMPALEGFYKGLAKHKRALRFDVEKICTSLKNGFAQIQSLALMDTSRSYLHQSMDEVYKQCNIMKGTFSDREVRRLNTDSSRFWLREEREVGTARTYHEV